MAKREMGPAGERFYKNVFVCMKCHAKIRADPIRVKKGIIKCRKCKSKALRPKAKERRGAK